MYMNDTTKQTNQIRPVGNNSSRIVCAGGPDTIKGKIMGMTKEEANKIRIESETVVAGYISDDMILAKKVCAENLNKWAYRRLETWPDLLLACKQALEVVDCYTIGSKDAEDKKPVAKLLKIAITNAEY